MAISSIVKTLRDSTLTITDGTRTCVVAFEEGTL